MTALWPDGPSYMHHPPPRLPQPPTTTKILMHVQFHAKKKKSYIHILTISATLPARMFLHQHTLRRAEGGRTSARQQNARLSGYMNRKTGERCRIEAPELAAEPKDWAIVGSRLKRPRGAHLPSAAALATCHFPAYAAPSAKPF